MVPDNLNLDFFLSPLDTSISKNIKTSIKKPWTKSFSDTLTLFQPGPMQRSHQKCPRGYISETYSRYRPKSTKLFTPNMIKMNTPQPKPC